MEKARKYIEFSDEFVAKHHTIVNGVSSFGLVNPHLNFCFGLWWCKEFNPLVGYDLLAVVKLFLELIASLLQRLNGVCGRLLHFIGRLEGSLVLGLPACGESDCSSRKSCPRKFTIGASIQACRLI